ncbi:MAG: hypothetical protein AAFQ22_12750 [Pseudomonadota bacterium]
MLQRLFLIAGCVALVGCGDGPNRQDYAEMIAFDAPELTDIRVASVRSASGNWKAVRGEAVLAEDLYKEVSQQAGGEACGSSWLGFKLALEEEGRIAVENTASAGDTVRLDYEIVADKAEPGDTQDVTSRGYRWGAWGGQYWRGDRADYQLGRVSSRIEGFETAIHMGTSEFEALCKRARAQTE